MQLTHWFMYEESKMTAIDAFESFEGTYKGMINPKTKDIFSRFRDEIANGNLEVGKDILEAAIKEATVEPRDLKTWEIIKSEINRYELYKLTNFEPVKEIKWDDVRKRNIERVDERLFESPQSLFLLKTTVLGCSTDVRFVGKKILSDLWVENKIPEIHCSLITADMILGILLDHRVTDSKVIVHFYPLRNGEKQRLMNVIIENDDKSAEVIFPFPLLFEKTRKELCSPPEGWTADDEYDNSLSLGEEHIRQYTIQMMKNMEVNKPTLYDPACSTGVFLSALKEVFPNAYTVGQDLSQHMADRSKNKVDQIYCGNAMQPKIETGSADFVFVRFLNSEVVTSAEAEDLLAALLPTIKIHGHLIIFGHTPVLLSSANFSALENFILLRSVGVAKEKRGIFQYYILQRIRNT